MARIKPYASLFRLSRPSNKLFVGQRGLKLDRCCERTTNWPRTSPWRILPSAKKERIENARWAESVPRPRRPHAIEQTEAFDSVFNSVVLLLRWASLSYIYVYIYKADMRIVNCLKSRRTTVSFLPNFRRPSSNRPNRSIRRCICTRSASVRMKHRPNENHTNCVKRTASYSPNVVTDVESLNDNSKILCKGVCYLEPVSI